MKFIITAFLSMAACLLALPVTAEEPPAGPTLYQRLGETEGIESIVRKTVALHEANPVIAAYVRHIDQEWLVGSVTAFFAAGTGGPNNYAGADMVTAHAHLDLTNEEFDAAVGDVLLALEAHDIDDESYAEVDNILQSFRGAVVSAGQEVTQSE
ncbi:MAG: group 1 truncated hemoglobin [Gammaproteobacteria bacterium]|nr:group 1 truncated hemoglobin [Gammaproteobacteria bacterium]